jgi:hypothetical protein
MDQRVSVARKRHVGNVSRGLTAEEKKIAGPHGFE